MMTAESFLRDHMPLSAKRTDLIRSVNATVLANPPKPTNPRATVKLVIEDMATAGLDASVLDKAKKLFEKNVKRTSPVYAALVTLLPHLSASSSAIPLTAPHHPFRPRSSSGAGSTSSGMATFPPPSQSLRCPPLHTLPIALAQFFCCNS